MKLSQQVHFMMQKTPKKGIFQNSTPTGVKRAKSDKN